MKRRRRWVILIVVLFVILGIIYLVVFGSKGRRSDQDKVEKTQIQYSSEAQSNILIAYFTAADNMPQELIPEAEVMPGISIQENMLDSDRLDETLEENLEEYIVR